MLTCAVTIFALCLQALGIALKLTFEGDNQFVYPQIYFCLLVSHEMCCFCNCNWEVADQQ